MLPIIAIVGRPNVGKSTLFNCFTRTRAALVGDVPGLTRDRQYGFGEYAGRSYILVDTGGIADFANIGKSDKKATENTIEQQMTKQAWYAVEEAQAVLFLVDARDGLIASDHEIATRLRKLNKKVYLVANKIDGLDVKTALLDFYNLGLGSPHAISATHKVGVKELQDKIVLKFPKQESEEVGDKKALKIAFIGRPNVGKSTLVNRILGEERVIVSDKAGTTRDSIFVEFTRRGKEYTLIDTAGIRRRGKVSDKNEKFSVIKALQAIEEANVVVLLLDAQENITDQDLKLLDFALEAGRAIVLAVNKWDRLATLQRDKIRSELDRRLGFIDFARIHFISALHGTGVGNLFSSIDEAFASATKQLKTPTVTKILLKAVEDCPPQLVQGRRIKLRYAHVGGHNPPLIVIHGNQAEEVPANYRKYLERIFREKLRLFGTPIRIEFRTSYNPYAK